MYREEDRTYAEDSKNTYPLIYGVKDPTTEEIEALKRTKREYCDNYLIPNFDKLFIDKNKRTVLEFGSGQGIMAEHISAQFKKYICVDVNNTFLDQCKDNTSNCNNVEYRYVKDYYFNGLEVEENSIDIITATNVFCHCNFYQFVIYFEKFYKLLKNDGVIFFDLLNSDDLDWSSKLIVEQKKYYQKTSNLNFIMYPFSSSVLIKQLSNIGLELIEDAKSGGGFNVLGFKKVPKII